MSECLCSTVPLCCSAFVSECLCSTVPLFHSAFVPLCLCATVHLCCSALWCSAFVMQYLCARVLQCYNPAVPPYHSAYVLRCCHPNLFVFSKAAISNRRLTSTRGSSSWCCRWRQARVGAISLSANLCSRKCFNRQRRHRRKPGPADYKTWLDNFSHS